MLHQVPIYLLIRQAAYGRIHPVARYIIQIIQIAEYTQLTELRYSCQQHKSEIAIHGFEYTIKSAKGVSKLVLQFDIIYSLMQRLIILIYQHNNQLPRLLVCTLYNACKSQGISNLTRIRAIDCLLLG